MGREQEILDRFHSNLDQGLSNQEVAIRIKKYGENASKKKEESSFRNWISSFCGPTLWLLKISALLLAILGKWPDFIVVVLLVVAYGMMKFFEGREVLKIEGEIHQKLILQARVLREGAWGVIPAKELALGDIVSIKNGDIVPADMILVQGEFITLSQEAPHLQKKIGDEVFSGSLVLLGEMVGVVTATGENAFNNRRSMPGERGGKKWEAMLSGITFATLAVCMILAISSLFRIEFESNIHESLAELVIYLLVFIGVAIPAMVHSRLLFIEAIGAKRLNQLGVLVQNFSSMEDLAKVDTLLLNKNGMLTRNQPRVAYIIPFNGYREREVLLSAYLASQDSEDPIDHAIFEEFGKRLESAKEVSDYKEIKSAPFDSAKKYAENFFDKGLSFVKGAPKVIAALTKTPYEEIETLLKGYAGRGMTALGVAKNGKFVGFMILIDPIREEAKGVIASLVDKGIEVKMVTGDQIDIAREVSKVLGMGVQIQEGCRETSFLRSDGFAEILPEQRVKIVEGLQKNGRVVGIVGENASEIEAIQAADVSIGAATASDAIIASSHLILTKPGPSLLLPAVEEGRKVVTRMKYFLLTQVSQTALLLFFLVISGIVLENEPLTPVMIAFIALLNAFPLMMLSFETGKEGHVLLPKNLWMEVGFLSFVWMIATFGLHWIGWKVWHMPPEMLRTLAFFALLTGGNFLLIMRPLEEKSLPSANGIFAMVGILAIGTIVTAMGLGTSNFLGIGFERTGYLWIYVLIWFAVTFFLKRVFLKERL